MLGEGFDDSWQPPARPARPLYIRLTQLEDAFLLGNAVALDDLRRKVEAAAVASGGSTSAWITLLRAAIELCSSVVLGNFVDALQSAIAVRIIGPADEYEVADCTLSTLASTGNFLRRRISRFLDDSDADEYSDSAGSTDTPRAYRAFCTALVAAAALNLFVQQNWTGPELSPQQLWRVNPLPYARSILGLNDIPEPPVDAAWVSGDTQRRQWQASTDTVAASESVAQPESQMTEAPPKSALDTASLASLHVSGGDEPFDLCSCPHLLATARALLSVLSPPVDLSFATESAAVSTAGAAATAAADVAALQKSLGGQSTTASTVAAPLPAATDPRAARVHAATAGLVSVAWLAGRACVIHQRTLVERSPSTVLWRSACAFFRRAAALRACPEHVAAFNSGDVFLRPLVEAEFLETSTQGSREPIKEEGAGSPSLESRGSNPAAVSGSPLAARLLLEWGLAQHFFGREAAAKTSFFLAKRETGLRTQLTGALGRRTKFQTFDTAQLVLLAASTGAQAAAAVTDAVRARQLGAAQGRFGAEALEKSGLLLSTASPHTTSTESEVPVANATSTQVSDAGARMDGVTTVLLDEADPDNILLEQLKLVDQHGGAATDVNHGTVFSAAVSAQHPAVGTEVAATSGGNESRTAAERYGPRDVNALLAASAVAPVDAPVAPSVVDGPLSALDQCVVLALCLDVRNSNPADGLTYEEMRTYVTRVLDTPLNWSVHSTALLVKSWLEFEGHRTAERAVLQMQALIDQHGSRFTPLMASQKLIDSAAPAADRLALVYMLVHPPQWELKRQTAERYKRLGVVRSALQLFEELGLWEEIITCHVALGQPKKAEGLLRARLAVSPSPRLWCLLGSVTLSDEPYLTAWELSGHSYARAQLALGLRYYERSDYPAAVKALTTGLALSPQRAAEWFLLGTICMRLEKYEAATEAFSRVVQLDPGRGEAWANLGGIYLHLHQWDRGFSALEQALRLDRKDWRMWSNFLVACMRTRHFSRALHAMTQLVDMRHADPDKNDGVDIPCLGLLVQEVLQSERARRARAVEARAPVPPTSDTATSQPASLFPSVIPTSLELEDDEGAQQPAVANTASATGSSDAVAAPSGDVTDTLDADGNPCYVHLSGLRQLFAHITAAVTRHARVWQLYAAVEEASGHPVEADDCRLRCVRSLMQHPGWAAEPEGVAAVAAASGPLVRSLLGRPATHPERAAGLMRARMHLSAVLSKIDAAGAQTTHPALEGLRALHADVLAAEAAAATAAMPAASAAQQP